MKVAVEFSPRRTQRHTEFRRGATVDGAAINVQFRRRSATRHISQPPFRGLKSTATISLSLRDRLAERVHEGSRGVQSTDNPAAQKSRRGAMVDGAAINVQFK